MSQDREFEKYLEGKSGMSKLYADLPEIEAPRHLDAAILAEAHRAVNSRPGGMPKRRWVIPLSMAASVIVAVMIGLQLPYMLKDAGKLDLHKEKIISAEQNTATSDLPAVAPAENLKDYGSFQSLTKSKPKINREESKSVSAAALMPTPEAQYAPAATAEPQLVDKVARTTGSVTDKAESTIASPPPAKAATRFELRGQAGIVSGNMQLEKNRISPQEEHRDAAALRKDLRQSVAIEPGSMQPLKAEESDIRMQPDNWLKHILKLKDDGKLVEAKKELLEFRKKYPGSRIPEILKFDK